jgi:hypothetical protein
MSEFRRGVLIGEVILAVILALAFGIACTRVHRVDAGNYSTSAASVHVKCWSGGQVIMDMMVYKAAVYSGKELSFTTADGHGITTADCIIYPASEGVR